MATFYLSKFTISGLLFCLSEKVLCDFFTQVLITVQYFERVCKDILELLAYVSLCNGENEVRNG